MVLKNLLRKAIDNRYCIFVARYGCMTFPTSIILLLFYNGYHSTMILDDGPIARTVVVVGTFIVTEIMANLICFRLFSYRNSIDYAVASNPAKAKPMAFIQRYSAGDASRFVEMCYQCDRKVPTRSHHCCLCRTCVIKADHHCFALGGCAGVGNYRFFVAFLFWASIGCLYGGFLCARYVHAFIRPWTWSWMAACDYLFSPKSFWMWASYGSITFGELGCITSVSIGILAGFFLLGAFLFQIFLIRNDQTYYEWNRKVRRPLTGDSSMKTKMEQVFGPVWYLNFLIPTPCWKNPIDENLRQYLYECQMKIV